VAEDTFTRHGFDRVLIELDIGPKAEAGIRCANLIGSMEELLLAKSDLAFGQLDEVQPYDQLRLYFVTEWVRQFGLGNGMLEFNEKDFNKYFRDMLKRLAAGTICISPSYLENHPILCISPSYLENGGIPDDPIPVLLSALTSDRRGFAMHKDYDVDI
jgi:hypothetical protein